MGRGNVFHRSFGEDENFWAGNKRVYYTQKL
jgi:hypothetical protein